MNPTSIDISSLERWQCEGVIEWLGHRSDIPALLADCHIACLPSYREGLPKSLAEAAASGRPIVTTDVPGCREVVRNGIEGLLVPARDASALASALERLIENQALRIQMGDAARRRAVALLSDTRVNSETLKLYGSILDGANAN
jgi:glycosyltransferase involved in cell wall biosynthesis